MTSIGAKVSQQGYDVLSCADDQLLFSSSFLTLPILVQGTYTVTDTTVQQTIYTHNLGYVPIFTVYVDDGDGSHLAQFYNDSYDLNFSLRMGTTDLQWLDDATNFGPITFKYFIFYRDMTTAISETIVIPTPISPLEVTVDYGIKVSKDGQDIRNIGLKDQVINSGGRTLLLDKIVTGTLANGTNNITVSHTLGYPPMFWFYVDTFVFDTRYAMVYNRQSQDAHITMEATTSSIVINNIISGGIGNYSCVVFKDPITQR